MGVSAISRGGGIHLPPCTGGDLDAVANRVNIMPSHVIYDIYIYDTQDIWVSSFVILLGHSTSRGNILNVYPDSTFMISRAGGPCG